MTLRIETRTPPPPPADDQSKSNHTTPQRRQQWAKEPPYHQHICSFAHSELPVNLEQLCQELWEQIAPFLPTVRGASGALLLRDPKNEANVAMVKLGYRELGTQYAQCVDSKISCAKIGIDPGSGAFAEHLAACTMRSYLELAKIPDHIIHIPYSGFGSMGHPYLFDLAFTQFGLNQSSRGSIGSSAVLHEFIPGCVAFDTLSDEVLAELDPLACQMLTLCNLVLLNADGKKENNLLQQWEKGKTIVPIDFSCILPKGAASSVVCHTTKLHQVNASIHSELKSFILEKLNPNILNEHLQEMKRRNIQEAENFSKGRLDLHAKAIDLLRIGVSKDLTLAEIASLFKKNPSSFEDRSIFKELVDRMGNSFKGEWKDLCQTCIDLYIECKKPLSSNRRGFAPFSDAVENI